MAKKVYRVINEHGEKVEANDFQKYLIDNGWGQYYHHNYWVHKKTIECEYTQDFTNYGYPTMEAVAYEKGWQKALKSVKHED